MGINDMRPEQRVFHIDGECYIVYVGRHPNDYKPFLRIGNTSSLDQEVKSLIYSVVVTDKLTGNPLDEAAAISEVADDEFRYIGDPKTVETFKNFLEHHEIPTGSYQSNGKETKDEHGVYVYFYDDANLKLRFESKPIFDLQIRETRDRHYPQRCKEVKNGLLKDPLRHGRRALERPGFFVVAGRTYLFDRSSVLSFGLDENTFFDLAKHGIDPDALATVFHQHGDLALERWLKRTRQKNTSGRVFTDQPEAVRGLIDLFRKLPTKPGRVEQVRFDPGGTQSFHELTVYRRDGHFLIDTHQGVGVAVQSSTGGPLGSGLEKPGGRQSPVLQEGVTIYVDASEGVWRRGGGKSASSGTVVLEGVPYRVHAGVPSFHSEFLDTYMPTKPGDFTGVFGDEHVQFLEQLRSAMEAVSQGRDASGQTRTLRGLAKSVGESAGDHFVISIHNARELLGLLTQSSGRNGAIAKAAAGVQKVLRGVTTEIDHSTTAPGLVCDLFVDENASVQLFPLTELVTADRLERHRVLLDDMKTAYSELDSETFEAEKERLYEVIGELHPKRSRERVEAAAGEAASTKSGAKPEKAASEARSTSDATVASAQGRSESVSDDTAVSSESATETAGGRTHREKSGAQKETETKGAGETRTRRDSGPSGGSQEKSDESRGAHSGRRRAILAAVALLFVVALFGTLFATGVIDGGSDARRDSEEAPTAESAENGSGDGQATEEGGGSAEDAVASNAGETDSQDAVASNAGDTDSADTAQNRIGDTTDVSPAIRDFIDSLDLENPPPGLQAREGPDGIIITILDIIRLANRIAEDNGYRQLGAPPSAGPNPDWIYPGNVFELPDGSSYTVVSGDTLWDITGTFLQEKLEERYRRYASLMDRYRSQDIARERLIEDLEALRGNSHSENFRNVIDQTIQEVQGS